MYIHIQIHTYTHIHIHIYIYIDIYVCRLPCKSSWRLLLSSNFIVTTDEGLTQYLLLSCGGKRFPGLGSPKTLNPNALDLGQSRLQ